MRRIALVLAAVVVLAGCRITTVFDARINFPDGVERQQSESVVTSACDNDTFWYGPGAVLIHADGSSDAFVGCNFDMSAPGAASDGTIYVGITGELPEDVSANSCDRPRYRGCYHDR